MPKQEQERRKETYCGSLAITMHNECGIPELNNQRVYM